NGGSSASCPAGSPCFIDIVVPDLKGASPGADYLSKEGSTLQRIAAYETGTGASLSRGPCGATACGNRTIRIYSNAPIDTTGVVDPLVWSPSVANGADTGDAFNNYVLKWHSAGTQFLVEMAGHLAVSGTPGTGSTAWGPSGANSCVTAHTCGGAALIS